MKKNRQECKLLLVNGAFSLKNKYVDPVLVVFAACWHQPIFPQKTKSKRSTTLKAIFKYRELVESQLFWALRRSLSIVRYNVIEANIFTFPTHTLQVELVYWPTSLKVLIFVSTKWQTSRQTEQSLYPFCACAHGVTNKHLDKQSNHSTPFALARTG